MYHRERGVRSSWLDAVTAAAAFCAGAVTAVGQTDRFVPLPPTASSGVVAAAAAAESSGVPVVRLPSLSVAPHDPSVGETQRLPPLWGATEATPGWMETRLAARGQEELPAPGGAPAVDSALNPWGGAAGVVGGAPGVPAGSPVLAAQPRLGDHFPKPPPCVGPGTLLVGNCPEEFTPDPMAPATFDPFEAYGPYDGKKSLCAPYPPLVLWRPFYGYGILPPAQTYWGKSNLLVPQLVVFGESRSAVASNRVNGDSFNVAATRLNLDFDLRLTSTERIHAAVAPLQRGNSFTRVEFDSNDFRTVEEFNFNFLTGYFEGDFGAIAGGLVDTVLPFDAPFAVGAMPLVYQNGTWFDDNVIGFAYTIPARHSTLLDISNYDLTFLLAWDGITSPAFAGDSSAARLYGATTYVEAWGGYLELGYAFLEDRSMLDRSYHNVGWSWTRRYGNWLSNSVRMIGNFGQSPNGIEQTADGVLFMLDSSLITSKPSTFVPYCNLWLGLDRPQSVARNGAAGGVLVRSGILLESDALTNYPTLDATGHDTWGAAVGVNMLPADFSHQLIAEVAMVEPVARGNPGISPAEQVGAGLRYQRPLSNSLIFRCDGMYGYDHNRDDNISGVRIELRRKF